VVSLSRRPLIGIGLLLALALPAQASAQAGALDLTFGGDGKVLTNSTPGSEYAGDLAIQADGKVVAGGFSVRLGGRIAVHRYNADGSLDLSFGGDGKVFTNLSPGRDWVGGMEVQPDGKIVVAGRSGGLGGMIALARYNPNGTLDTTFSGNGWVATNFTTGDEFAFGMALQADGKIVATGRAGRAGGRIAVVRYTADGALDPTFSGDGRVAVDFTPGDDRADHVVIQADGKIVAAGTANYHSTGARFALIRLHDNGALDSSFSGDGKVTTNLVAGFDGAFEVAVQPSDGKIVAGGQAGRRVALLRYTDVGALDPAFSGDGKVFVDFTAGLDYAEELEIQNDGKIVAAGTANYFGRNARFALMRFEATGVLDGTFSGDGKVITDFTPGFDAPFGLALQPADGKIVVAGEASRQGGRFALARYHGN
jgi:uncharacterized delta-60 repeat protein